MTKHTGDTTVKARGGLLELGENEIEAQRTKFLEVFAVYQADPTNANRDASKAEYRKLQEIKKLYRDGRKAIIQKRVIEKQVQS